MGLTIVHKSDLTVRKRNPRIALVLAGGAVTGGAFKLGGLKALDDFLVNRKTTDFDIYVGLSAGRVPRGAARRRRHPARDAARARGHRPRTSPSFAPLDFYQPEPRRVRRRKPVEFAGRPADLRSRAWSTTSSCRRRSSLRALEEPLADARRRPTLSTTCSTCVTPIVDAIGSAREFPFPLDYLPSGLFDNASLERYLRHNLERRGMTQRLPRPLPARASVELYIVAMNLDTAERVVFGHDEDTSLTISEAVQASTALPGFYKPARIKRRRLRRRRRAAHRQHRRRHRARRRSGHLLQPVPAVLEPRRPPLRSRSTRHYVAEGRPLADRGMLTVLNQVFRTLLHSRLQLGLRQYQDDPNFQGDIILIEPTETRPHLLQDGAAQPVGGPQRRRARLPLGHESIETHYDLIRQILQSYGILMTRKEVREGLERLLTSEPTEAPDDVLLREVPKRNLHVA